MSLRQGEIAEARQAARECREIMAGERESILTRIGLCGMALLHEWEDPERCIAEMVKAGGPELEETDPAWSTFLMQVLARAALRTGDPDGAHAWAAGSRSAEALRLEPCAARAAATRGAVLLADGEAKQAGNLACQAAADAHELGSFLDSIGARLIGGRALATLGRRDEAVTELRRVAEEAGRGRHTRLRDAAAKELRQLGVRLSAASARGDGSAAGLEALSEREREIVTLAVEGRSNKEVAATLFLSAKTIEHHLSRAYGKLGVRSRVGLASLVARESDARVA